MVPVAPRFHAHWHCSLLLQNKTHTQAKYIYAVYAKNYAYTHDASQPFQKFSVPALTHTRLRPTLNPFHIFILEAQGFHTHPTPRLCSNVQNRPDALEAQRVHANTQRTHAMLLSQHYVANVPLH
ncbi:hypothetical protein RJT34_02111 [Clitoria ternatea]|uniref:Uncharacterized protein n=1 Tax=Clitoria ternatea TaxID=43366 RepID=A0AAN9KGV7_CLITE